MSTGLAIAALVISLAALGFSGYAVVQGERRARRAERRDAALGPEEAVRAAVVTARTLLQDVVSRGGQHSAWFQHESRKRTALTLRDHAARVGDEKLATALRAIAETWDLCHAHAPPRQYMTNLARQEDNGRMERLAKTAELAPRGLDECKTALTRLNELAGA